MCRQNDVVQSAARVLIHGEGSGGVAVATGGQSQDLVLAPHHHVRGCQMSQSDLFRRLQHAGRGSGHGDQPTAEADERLPEPVYQAGDIGQKQALQLAPAHVFLPSAPVGTPKPFEMTKKSLKVGNDERECLNQESRSGVVH